MPFDPVIAQTEPAGLDRLDIFNPHAQEEVFFIAVLYGVVFLVGFLLLTAFTLRVQRRPLSWSEPLARLFARPWSWRHALAVVIPLITVQIMFAGIYSMKDPPAEIPVEQAERNLLMMQGVLFHGVGLLLILLLLRKCRIDWSTAFGLQSGGLLRQAGWGMLILIGTMPIILSFNIAAHVVMAWWGVEPQIQDVTRVISGASGWLEKSYFIMLAVILAPVVEEMIFRGLILPALSQIIGVRGALVGTAMLFSLVHGFYLPAFFVFFILSVAFSLAYIYRGSLIVPITMHALFNGLTMSVLIQL